MNKKGQVSIGFLIVAAIAVIIGLVLLSPIASNVDQTTRTVSGTTAVENQTITAPASGSIVESSGQELVGIPKVYNESGASLVITSPNYTISECVKTSDSLKGICYKALTAEYEGKNINVSYTYYPAGYADDAGSRSIAGIIVLLAAIGIAVVCIPKVKELLD